MIGLAIVDVSLLSLILILIFFRHRSEELWRFLFISYRKRAAVSSFFY